MENGNEVFKSNEGTIPNKYDLKNTMEIVDAAEYLTVKTVKASHGGFQLSDLIGLADKNLYIKVKDAAKDSRLVALELKDLTPEEKDQIVARFLEFAKNVAAAAL